MYNLENPRVSPLYEQLSDQTNDPVNSIIT